MTDALGAWRARVRRAGGDTAVGAAIAAGAMAALALFLVTAYFVTLFVIGIGAVALPVVTKGVRRLCNLNRRAAGRVGVPVAVPYRPQPREFEKDIVGWMRRRQWILTDPATWRDLLWLLLDTAVGTVGLLPAAVLCYALEGFVVGAGLWRPLLDANGTGWWYCFITVDSRPSALLALAAASGLLLAWPWTGRPALKAHAYFTRFLLGPTENTVLASRVRHLAETRTTALDTQAAELRRIERDLHDGAQARLVSLGFTLGAVERNMDRKPEEARRLLREARESSVLALRELRDLVRGIHPPVLAERGLADAVRALGIDSPLQVAVETDVPGGLPAPVESAMYFSVSELLTNALKHSGADRVEIELRHGQDVLYARVADDGRGGADAGRGTGLHGIRRRLAAFDGTLDISSPVGGPTVTKMEIPCALSSPKTSSS
ncbi:histidine kinase [Streptomyces hiroshimensis]|uniref:histidine kinase n=1 Tax=Streptomyces hiroshimensis TaxID=66424 RepID=A0ABQ2Z128_9ACTN|nr:sensor domain-containing protein [Streptomyces hiroshimensis]GGX98611.1 histidine kinase [Streptomyces hiroshimensis]